MRIVWSVTVLMGAKFTGRRRMPASNIHSWRISKPIYRQQAAKLRAKLQTFAEDWESEEMRIYDDYDAAKSICEGEEKL
jgi:hypothetical protein